MHWLVSREPKEVDYFADECGVCVRSETYPSFLNLYFFLILKLGSCLLFLWPPLLYRNIEVFCSKDFQEGNDIRSKTYVFFEKKRQKKKEIEK